MPLVKPNAAAITATINDAIQSDGSLAEALDTSVLWALNKLAVDPLSSSVIATQSGLGRWRAKVVGTAGAFVLAFVDGDLAAGVLTVSHGLGAKYVEVAVYDDTDTQVTPDFVVLIDANTLAVDLTSFGVIPGTWHVVVLAGGGGPGSGLIFPNRYDLSVNGARVENAGSDGALLITQTDVNVAGAYNGGGTGNKAILGCNGHAGIPLGALGKITWEWQQISDEPLPFMVYANLIIDTAGAPGLMVFPIDPALAGPLNTGTLTLLGPGHYTFTHDPAVNYVQVVQVPLGPGNNFCSDGGSTGPVPVALGPTIAGTAWPAMSFKYSDIIAGFPAAATIDASTLDGGLPKTTVTPALLLIVGDSVNHTHHVERLITFLFNGAPA
jgi:hypothetical protein